MYTLDANVTGPIIDEIKPDGESDENFVKRGLGYLTSNIVMILSYQNNEREHIVNIKFKDITEHKTVDKSIPITDGGTFTGQIVFYKFEILNKIVNSWISNNSNSHHYYNWIDYFELNNNFRYSGLNNNNLLFPESEPESEPEQEPESEPEQEPEADPEQEPESEPEMEPEAEL